MQSAPSSVSPGSTGSSPTERESGSQSPARDPLLPKGSPPSKPALPSPPDWPLVDSRPGPDLLIFRARFDRMINPRTGLVLERMALQSPDWVNVIALTPEGEVLLLRQFRFGAQAVVTEIPAGTVDPGEDHATAARRELLEETGHAADRWTYLGSVDPNPAFLDNRCHHWLAEDARQIAEPRPEAGEDIRCFRLPLDEVRAMLRDGRIDHSLVLSAFFRWSLLG